jgi:hypothetical protein
MNASLEPTQIGVYRFGLNVMDINSSWSEEDDTWLTVNPAGTGPPVAYAGPDQTIELGHGLILDGSASTDDQEVVAYHWSLEHEPVGSNITVQDIAVQTVTPTIEGNYQFSLMVKDNDNLWCLEASYVNITVIANKPPIAKIHEPKNGATFLSTENITFDATGSMDPEDGPLNYSWASDKDGPLGNGSMVTRNLTAGQHLITLAVTDDHQNTGNATANITIKLDELPVAKLNVSETLIPPGTKVKLDGSKSKDAEGPLSKFKFEYGDGEDSGWITDQSKTHVYTKSGRFNATLRVMDGPGQESLPVSVEIIVNRIPIAALSVDQVRLGPGDEVTLDASNSTDSDGAVVQYLFDFGNGADSGWVNSSIIRTQYPRAGNYKVSVKVRDNYGFESENAAEISLTVTEPEQHSARSGQNTNLLLPLAIVMIVVVIYVAVVALKRR